MPIRIYDISKKLGLDNKEILAKAKILGITAAKVPSSALELDTAVNLEAELRKDHPELDWRAPSLMKPQINITGIGAELHRLVERVINDEIQISFEVAETEYSERLHFSLTRDVNQKSPSAKPKLDLPPRVEIDKRTKNLLRLAYETSRLNCSEEWVNLAEYGNAVKKLDPTFQPQDFGERSLGSLLRRVTDLFELRNDEANPIVYYLRMKEEMDHSSAKVSTPNASLQASQVTVPSLAKLAKGKIHNLRLGFGFIMPDDGSENAFFHATDVEGCTIFDLKPGDSVEYEPGTNERGPCGRKVRRLI